MYCFNNIKLQKHARASRKSFNTCYWGSHCYTNILVVRWAGRLDGDYLKEETSYLTEILVISCCALVPVGSGCYRKDRNLENNCERVLGTGVAGVCISTL